MLKAKELIDHGCLGQPFSCTMDWVADCTRLTRSTQLYPDPDQPEELAWKYRRDKSPGGKLIYHGTHYIDAIQWLVGDTLSAVTCLTANVTGAPLENEDAAVLSFQMENTGLVGTLNTGYYVIQGGKQCSIRLWGSEGWFFLELDGREAGPRLQWQTNYDDDSGVQTWEEPPPAAGGSKADGYRDLTVAAVRFANGRGPPPMRTSESRAVMRAVFAGYAAAESGRTQRIASLLENHM